MSLFSKVQYHLQRVYLKLTSPFRKLPDFIIIGVQKGGTSSLFHYLSQHPELRVARKKEIHFFNFNYQKGLAWYRGFFPFKWVKQKTGEASPAYILHPLVPHRIHQTLPKVKLIVLLRRPVDRAFSHFQMQRNSGLEPLQSFEDALEREKVFLEKEARIKQQDPAHYSYDFHNFSYLSRGLYYQQISHWLTVFPKEQFLFLKSEAFYHNPKETLSQIYSFLGVSERFPENLSPKNVGTYQDKMDRETQNYLVQYFKKDEERLKELLGSSFTWSA